MATVMVTGAIDEVAGRAMSGGLHGFAAARGWLLCRYGVAYLAEAIAEWRPDAVVAMLDDAVVPHGVVGGSRLVCAGKNATARGIASILVDDAAAGRLAAEHLLSRGIRSLACFGYWAEEEADHNSWALVRAAAMRDVALAAGVPYAQFGDRIDPATGRPEAGHAPNIMRWLTELPKPAGVLVGCDHWGETISIMCRRAHLRVPEEVALIGIDDDQSLCETMDPPLSSVIVPWRRIGYEAGLLVERLLAGDAGGGASGPVLVPPSGVTVRRSSDTLAVPDADVAAAMAVIHRHADRPLSVAQILREVPVYQHRLERKFKSLVGRRMTEEIRRVHVEQAKRLLATSDMTMPDVARRSGFADAKQFSTAFNRDTGMTPTAYRRQYQI